MSSLFIDSSVPVIVSPVLNISGSGSIDWREINSVVAVIVDSSANRVVEVWRCSWSGGEVREESNTSEGVCVTKTDL